MTFHPWRELRGKPHIEVHWRDLPIDLLGYLDGDTIVMSSRQLQVERRCTITHELIHHERGETCGATERDEEEVRQETARRLVTIERLGDALRWSMDVHEIADHCWVDLDILTTRLGHLHPSEVHYLRRVTAHHRGDDDDSS